MPNNKIFISYAREDATFVKKLHTMLEDVGYQTWLDVKDLRAGMNWQPAIDDALRSASTLIVVLSPAAIRSRYVNYEWAYALGAGANVVPVLRGAVKLHPRLSAIQHVDATQPGQFWLRLIDALDGSGAPVAGASPSLRASFDKEDGRPRRNGDEYVIDLEVLAKPRWAKRVRYECHNPTFDPRLWTEKNPAENFATWLSSYGDVLISAELMSKNGDRRRVIQTTLYRALLRSHGEDTTKSVAKALRAIRDN